jgi:ArsR family transcriptional regulator, arsenate/arsenite/antimonite-responsive transcriptional repressor
MNAPADSCCSPVAPIAGKLAALAHPARIEILRHLSCHEACCCKDVVERLDLAQSTVSQHLKVLVEAGLVRFEPQKQRSRYAVDRAALAELSRSVAGLLQSCCGESRRD